MLLYYCSMHATQLCGRHLSSPLQVTDQVVSNPIEHSRVLMEMSTAAKLAHPNIVR